MRIRLDLLPEGIMVLVACMIPFCIHTQCPNVIWNTANIGETYVDDRGRKTIFGDFSNLSESQYVNDGHLFLFGDMTNDGYFGDGNGYESILRCNNTATTIAGNGNTEFNIVTFNNPSDILVKKRVDIKKTLMFTNGIIHTDRKIPSEEIYFLEGSNYFSNNDSKHINGTVSKQGANPFIFPIGDGDHQSRLKTIGQFPFDIYKAAYYSHNLNFFDFLSPGSFPVDSTAFNVHRVQEHEFWTLEGGQATQITLFWTDYSDIYNLVDDVSDLIVVGWTDNEWQNLGNTEVVEIFGTGTLRSQSVIPNQYDAYTFGVLDSDGDGVVESVDNDPFDPCVPDMNSEACLNRICVDLETSVFLEGALTLGGIENYGTEMRTQINRFGYLPGKRPTTLLGVATDPGQPYDVAPWQYFGAEGEDIDEFNSNNQSMYPEDAVDWVLVSLRSDPSVESTVCQKAALLMSDGEVIFTEFFDCCGIPDQAYYIVIEHRNHLPVMTPVPINPADGVFSYDFRVNQSYIKLLGYGQKEVAANLYAMYAGNGDQMINIESRRDLNSNDISLWAMDNGKHSGYYFQDYDLSGDVNVHDKAVWLVNNGVFTDVEF